jgi:hypothetical protein
MSVFLDLEKFQNPPFFWARNIIERAENYLQPKNRKNSKICCIYFSGGSKGAKGAAPPPQQCHKKLLKMVEKRPKMDPKQGVTPRQWG